MGTPLPDGWRELQLKDLVDRRITYGVVQPGAFVDEGVPLVRVTDFDGQRVRSDSLVKVAPEVAARHPRSTLFGGEVLVTLVGTTGLVAIADEDLAGCNVARAVGVLPIAEREVARWVAWTLRGPTARLFFSERLNTTVQKTLNLRDLAAFPVALPPRAEMQAASEVLAALDDKIKSNRRTAQAARAVLMQALPAGREPVPLDQIADFHNGGALTKQANGSGRPILRIKELRAGVTVETPRTDATVRETHEAAAGDLLFSWSGTLLTTRWCGEPAVLNQHLFRVDPRPPFSRWFVEAWIERHLDHFRSIAADKATTMGHIQRRHLTEALVALPAHGEIVALMRTYGPLDDLRLSLLCEAERLVNARNALLPRLVSGRLRVPLTSDRGEVVGSVLNAV